MMYGHGFGWAWMVFMPLFWIALLAVVIWAIVRLVSPGGAPREVDGAGPRRESAREILDRRFAAGEIDADTYTRARERLSGSVRSS
jgi:putative membrane protein